MSSNNKGKLIIVSAPSGAGKTTLVHYLLDEISNLEFSVSCTTRKPRGNEVDGKDYYFITVPEFKDKIEKGEFVEYEEVYEGLYYGTLYSEIQRITDSGNNVIFDIDVMGGMNLKKEYPDALSIFIKPPSSETLRERLEVRNTEDDETRDMRIQKADLEMQYLNEFDVQIENDNLDQAKSEILDVTEDFLNA